MCTNISIPRKSTDDPLVSARTMDWFMVDPAFVNFVPRGQSFPEANLPGEIHWRNKYAFIGAGFKLEGFPMSYSDGLNEAGLSAAGLWLSCSEYPSSGSDKPVLYNSLFVPYVLGNFRDIHQAEAALLKLTVPNISELYPDAYSLLHYIISDVSGHHLIVEFLNGEMHVYHSNEGMLTNQPAYDWHLTNNGFYGELSLKDNTNIVCGEEVTGSGQLGIPGDPSPQSRFIRAAFLQQTAFHPKSTQEAVGLARQILQTLSVPIGTVILQSPPQIAGFFDWTQWSVIRDHTNLVYYFYSDYNSKLYGIHLKALNLNASKQKSVAIVQPHWYKDITHRFES